MGPPRDRLQNLQSQAYFGDDDDYHIPIDEDDNGPMQKFFREVEELRGVVDQVIWLLIDYFFDFLKPFKFLHS